MRLAEASAGDPSPAATLLPLPPHRAGAVFTRRAAHAPRSKSEPEISSCMHFIPRVHLSSAA
jgi:hypothetical protein